MLLPVTIKLDDIERSPRKVPRIVFIDRHDKAGWIGDAEFPSKQFNALLIQRGQGDNRNRLACIFAGLRTRYRKPPCYLCLVCFGSPCADSRRNDEATPMKVLDDDTMETVQRDEKVVNSPKL